MDRTATTTGKAIRTIDMRLIDDLFGMGGGYVLDFSDRTFASFFAEELGVNIDDSKYSAEGTSKAKRLRYFLKNSGPGIRIRTLLALWEYREADRRRKRIEDPLPGAEVEFGLLIERLGGKRPSTRAQPAPSRSPAMDIVSCPDFLDRLLTISRLDPQPRGYAFEHFLKDLFDANSLTPRPSFRLIGEQIDGSFELSGEVYLLEARWKGLPTGAADLWAFDGKVKSKAAWSRGFFLSNSGFTEDGLTAFGRGNRVVCMDGLDLHDMLSKGLSFSEVMAKKVRHAAESGSPFVRVRDLYP